MLILLPEIKLAPQQSTVVNLREFQENGTIPSWVEMGNIDLQYQGEGGALVAELASVDQNGSFVSPVPLTCRGNRSLHMSYWRTDGDWHSSVTLENIAPEENRAEVTISYLGGIYLLEKKLAAGETAMVSVNELQQSQEPDREGRRIPREATLGGMNIWSPDVISGLVINAMLVNPVTRTCGSCGGLDYVTQFSISDKPAFTWTPLYAGFYPHIVGEHFQVYFNVHYSQGAQSADSVGSSSSSNTAVATIPYNGAVDCVSVGNANITAYSQSGYFTDVACSQTHILGPSYASLTVIRIDIKQDGTVITNTTRNVIVGQKISLTAEVQPTTGVTVTNQRWTIPGVRVANYVVTYTSEASPTSATVTTLGTNPGGPAVDFYWVDGGDGRQVQFSVKINGTTFIAITTFNVKRPTATFASSSGANVTVDSTCGALFQLRYGCDSPGTFGITFSVTNLVIPTGFSGTTELVQVVNSTTRTKLKNTGVLLTLQGTGLLDTTFPYGLLFDSPKQPFDFDTLRVTASDSFTMYLIFKPSLSSSIWVPLRKISWSWSGDASNDGTLHSSSHSPGQTGVDSSDHPQWPGNVVSLRFN